MNIETRIRDALNPDYEPMASTCCHGECLQGRSCPYRSAVTPKDELPGPRRKSTEWEVWLIWGVAGLLLALVFIALMLEVVG